MNVLIFLITLGSNCTLLEQKPRQMVLLGGRSEPYFRPSVSGKKRLVLRWRSGPLSAACGPREHQQPTGSREEQAVHVSGRTSSSAPQTFNKPQKCNLPRQRTDL